MQMPKYLRILFWWFLIIIIVQWAPKPYSNYEGPWIMQEPPKTPKSLPSSRIPQQRPLKESGKGGGLRFRVQGFRGLGFRGLGFMV